LGENGRNQAALRKYAQFPADSPYRLTVLLNQAELLAENGDLANALELSRQAYKMSPALSETQLCYADKLHKTGNSSLIPDVVKFSSGQTYRPQLEKLWIAGMEERIKQCNIVIQKETVKELCRRLLSLAPGNRKALDVLMQLKN
jgi:hypothetical protein